MKRIFEIDPWKVVTHEFKPEEKRLQESMTSIGNEYMGMRGMFEETYSGDTHKGIYLGGVWYPDKTRVGWRTVILNTLVRSSMQLISLKLTSS